MSFLSARQGHVSPAGVRFGPPVRDRGPPVAEHGPIDVQNGTIVVGSAIRCHGSDVTAPLHAVSGTTDVLVVCHANITRSPLFAAMLAERWGPLGISVGSAGVRALVGSGADPGSVEEARVRNLSIDHHVSRQVDVELVEGASLVLTMSEAQRDELVHLSGRATEHIFTTPEAVRLAAHVGPVGLRPGLEGLARMWHQARPVCPPAKVREDVPDPHGGPLVGFVRLGMQFDRYVSVLTASE